MSQLQDQGRAILVLGMHRTGTSLTMAAVEALGVDSGSHLLLPGPDNETGYWEDRSILDLNERLLAALGKTWSSVGPIDEGDWSRAGIEELRREAIILLKHRFRGSRLWGFKDPRTIRVLPFWQGVLAELGVAVQYVVSFRNPESVAASLAYRNRFSRTKSHYLWLSHYLFYLDRLIGENCLFVDYDALIDDPHRAMQRIGCFVHGAGNVLCSEGQARVDTFLDGTLRKSLRHTRFENGRVDADAPAVLSDTCRLLEKLATHEAPSTFVQDVKALLLRYRNETLLLQQIDSIEAEAERLRKLAHEEEVIRDKIEKMGLYQADIHKKLELIDARHVVQAKRNENLNERLSAVERRLDVQQETLSTVDARVEDIQEKVVVQIDELHRIIGAAQASVAARRRARQSHHPEDLAAAQAHIESIYRSTSWRITKPVRAAKVLALKLLSGFRS